MSSTDNGVFVCDRYFEDTGEWCDREGARPYITAPVGACVHGIIAHGCGEFGEWQPVWRCSRHAPRKVLKGGEIFGRQP